jgi:O-antigen/teichoic acid export membrane protein
MSKVRKIATIALGRGLNTIVNFLFLPYLSRTLSYTDYGSYGQTLLIITFLVALLSFGLHQIIYVFLNSHRSKEVLTSSVFGSILLAIVGVSFIFLFNQTIAEYFGNPELSSLLSLYSFTLLLILPFQILNSYLIYKGKVKVSATIALVTNLIKIILVFIAIHDFNSVYYAFIGILISQIIQLAICLVYAHRDLWFKIDTRLLLQQLKSGLPLGLTGVLGSGILYIDGVMVSKIEGIQSYAIYRNGALEVPFIATIYASIAAIVLPEIARLFKTKNFEEIFILKKKVIMNTIFITYPILVFLLFYSSDLILVYLGSKYISSAIIFSVFNLTLLIRINDYSDILIAANKSKYIFKSYLFTFLLNITLNYLFINLLGSVGAAIGTVLSIIVLAALQLTKSMSLINKRIINLFEWKKLAHLLTISILLIGFFRLTSHFFELKPSYRIIYSAMYFPLVYLYLFKFNFFSKEIINSLFKRKLM